MRLALALGRTVRELEATMLADEWADWLAFHAHYDLPDDFMVVAQLGALVSSIAGGKLGAADLAPYYKSDAESPADLRPALAFMRAYVQERQSQRAPRPGGGRP